MYPPVFELLDQQDRVWVPPRFLASRAGGEPASSKWLVRASQRLRSLPGPRSTPSCFSGIASGRNLSPVKGLQHVVQAEAGSFLPPSGSIAPQMLFYLSHHTGSAPFWYTVDVKESNLAAESSKAIIKWQVYMAIVNGAAGILFYNYYYATPTGRNDVKYICKEIKQWGVSHLYYSKKGLSV